MDQLKNWLYALVVFIANVHDKLMTYNYMLSSPYSDKEMHFVVVAVFGVLFFLLVLPLFVFLTRHGRAGLMAWLFTFMTILFVALAASIIVRTYLLYPVSSTSTVTAQEADTLPADTVMLQVPTPTTVTVPLLTVATLVSEDIHLIVSSWSAGSAVAVSVAVFPIASKDNALSDSDIDVAIIINSNQNTFDLLVELMMYTQNIDLRIEPHPIKKEDFENRNPFVQEILATGLKVA